MVGCCIAQLVRLLEHIWQHLIKGSQALLSLQVWCQSPLLTIFVPFLASLVVLAQEVSSDLVVHDSFDCSHTITDWQSNQYSTHTINIVMHYTGRRYRILNEFISQRTLNSQMLNIRVKGQRCFLLSQHIRISKHLRQLNLPRSLKYS